VLQADERAEAREFGDLAGDQVADLIIMIDVAPRIDSELLDADRDALIGLIDFEHNRLDLVALLEHLGGMIDLARPGNVRDVDHAVQTFLQFDESAIAGKIANLAFDFRARRVLLHGFVPRIGFELADAEGDFLLLAVDAQHHGLKFLIDLEYIRRLGDALGPGKFGDVNEAFDAGFQFHKRAVRHQIDNLALDLGANRILAFNIVPRIGELLLETEADAFLLAIDVEDNHVDVLADAQNVGRMIDAAPAHVGDVEQAVDAIEVDERAEIGDILDRAFANVARRHVGEQLGAAFVAFLFDEFAAGKDNVLPFLVDLDDLEVISVADITRQILGGGDVDLGSGQESFDADIDEQAAFDHRFDFAGDGAAFIANGEDLVPVLFELGLFLGEDNHALFVLELFDQDVDFVADLDDFDVFKFIGRDDPFAFVADVHEHFLGTDFDDGSFDDFASCK